MLKLEERFENYYKKLEKDLLVEDVDEEEYFGMTKDEWYDWANNEYQEAYSETWPDDDEILELREDVFETWFAEVLPKAKSERDLYLDLGERIFNAVC